MAPKRALYFTYGDDEKCAETRKFMEESGVILQIRDLAENPLTEGELIRLVGHLKLEHFLNPSSPNYSKHNLNNSGLCRGEIIKLMAADHTLLKRPIVKAGRLLLIGCDQAKIAEMLQLENNGSEPSKDPPQPKSNKPGKKAQTARS